MSGSVFCLGLGLPEPSNRMVNTSCVNGIGSKKINLILIS